MTEATPDSANTTAPSWDAGLSELSRGIAQNKGWKGPEDVITSYTNLEKSFGVPAERLVTLPKDPADTAAMTKVYERLGRPAAAKDYKVEWGAGADKGFTEWASNQFHAAGLNNSQAQAIVKAWGEYTGKLATERSESIAKQTAAQEQAVMKEWGMAAQRNIEIGKKAVAALGWDAKTLSGLQQTLGLDGLLKLAHQLGTKIGEDKFVGGDNSRPGFAYLTPEAAKAKIAENMADKEFAGKYLSGGVKERKEMDELHRLAYPVAA